MSLTVTVYFNRVYSIIVYIDCIFNSFVLTVPITDGFACVFNSYVLTVSITDGFACVFNSFVLTVSKTYGFAVSLTVLLYQCQ